MPHPFLDTADLATFESEASVPIANLEPQVGPSPGLVHMVDLMMLFTAQAREGAGGLNAIQRLVELSVAEANTVFQNSQVALRLRLIATAEISYDETMSHATNLTRLRDPKDGYLDAIHALRETNRADLVCLVTEGGDPGFSGLATIMPEASLFAKPFGFSVIKRKDAVGSYTLAHELGHNFGCQHDRENAFDRSGSAVPGLFHFSYGHRFTYQNTVYRTVMAYAPGQVVPFFSSPNIIFGEVPLGISSLQTNTAADNVLTLNSTAAIVSGYYGPAVQTQLPLVQWINPGENSVFREDHTITLELEASDPDGTIRRVEVFSDAQTIVSADNPSNTRMVFAWTGASPGHHRLVARITDSHGASAATLPLPVAVRPKNDAFADRISIAGTTGEITGSNRAATSEGNETALSPQHGLQSVWYAWTAPRAGSVVLTTQGRGFIPLPSIYRGRSLESLTSESISLVFEGAQFKGTLGFEALPNQDYAIAVGSQQGYEGDFTFTLAYLENPPNDDFRNRTALSGESVHFTGSNVGATAEPTEPLHASNPGGKSIWYEWTAPRSGSVQITCASEHVVFLVDVYRGTALQNLTVAGPRSIEFASSPPTSTLIFSATAGLTYALALDGFEGRTSSFNFALDYLSAAPNDAFAQRTPLLGNRVVFEASNVGATAEAGEPTHAGAPGGKSLWYSWIAPVTGPVTVTITDDLPGFVAIPDAYQGSNFADLKRVATSISANTNGISTVTFDAVLGQSYELVVDGYGGTGGVFTFVLETRNQPAAADTASASASPDGVFRFSIRGTPGQRYSVQRSTDLEHWIDLAPGTLEAGSFTFTDKPSPGSSQHFYRVLPRP